MPGEGEGSRRAAPLWVGWVLGAIGAAAADLVLFMVDDSCPQWEDEGTMAAPHSPYALVMCSPATQEPPFTWVVIVAAALGLLLTLWWWRRPAGWGSRVLQAVVLVVAPTLLVGLLHVALPEDCLGGPTRTGECSRDRELR